MTIRRVLGIATSAALLGSLFSASAVSARTPEWPIPQPDPVGNPRVAGCGTQLDIILDASGSIQEANAVNEVREAARTFLTALANTGSSSQMVQFGTEARITAPSSLVTTASLQPGGVFDTALDAYFKNGEPGGGDATPRRRINRMLPNVNPLLEGSYMGEGTGNKGTTNWQQPLEIAADSGNPRLTVFLTDGDPTAVVSNGRSNTGMKPDPWPGYFLTMPSSPEGEKYAFFKGVEAANSLKSEGSRILVVGVGRDFNDDTTSMERLKAVAGPTGDESEAKVWSGVGDGPFDVNTFGVARVKDYDDLAKALAKVAGSICAPSVTIQKLAETATGYDAAPGWDMTVTPSYDAPTTYKWVQPNKGSGPGSQTEATDANGKALFQWDASDRSAGKAAVTESLKPGWFMQGVTCTRRDPDGLSDAAPFVNGRATFSSIPFEVPVGPDSIVTCTMLNGTTPQPATGSLRISKAFDPLTSGATSAFAMTYACDVDGDVVKEGKVSLKAGESTTVDGILSGAECTVKEENLPEPPSGWSYGQPTFAPSNAVKIVKGQTATVTVTNTIGTAKPAVACPTKVNYVKRVVKRNGKYVLVRNVKTNSSCVVVKPVVSCRPMKPSAAGEVAYCRVATRANGRIVISVQGTGKVRVRSVVRVKPKPAFRDQYKATATRKNWVLKA